MTTRLLWITDDPFDGLTAETIAAADEAGATEILHGVPSRLTNLVDPLTRGFVELTIPDPEEVEPIPSPFQAFAADLQAKLSTATTLTKMRTVLDEAVEAGLAVE